MLEPRKELGPRRIGLGELSIDGYVHFAQWKGSPNPIGPHRQEMVSEDAGHPHRAAAVGRSAVAMMFDHGHGGPWRQQRSQVTVSQQLRSCNAAPGANEHHTHRGSHRPAVQPGRCTGVSNEITTALVGQTDAQPGVHDVPLLFACAMAFILPVYLDKETNCVYSW